MYLVPLQHLEKEKDGKISKSFEHCAEKKRVVMVERNRRGRLMTQVFHKRWQELAKNDDVHFALLQNTLDV